MDLIRCDANLAKNASKFEIRLYIITNVVKEKSHPRTILSLEKLTHDKTCANSNLEDINIHSLEVFAQKTFIGKSGDHWHRRQSLRQCHQTHNSLCTSKCSIGWYQITHLTIKHMHFKAPCQKGVKLQLIIISLVTSIYGKY